MSGLIIMALVALPFQLILLIVAIKLFIKYKRRK